MGDSPDRDKLDEVEFLADSFGIPPLRGAALLTEDSAQVAALASQAMQDQREGDALAGKPVPDGTKDPDHVEKQIADMDKPVRHDESAPT